MAWKVELDPGARWELDRLDAQAARRILAFPRDRVARADNPRAIAKALRKNGSGSFWRYRVGDYRIVVSIDYRESRILVLRIGDRRDIYRTSGRFR